MRDYCGPSIPLLKLLCDKSRASLLGFEKCCSRQPWRPGQEKEGRTDIFWGAGALHLQQHGGCEFLAAATLPDMQDAVHGTGNYPTTDVP
jgi:hypothetical protein